jgi:hypothetical protein
MKAKQLNFTTPQQAKKLLAIGLPANSADCYWEPVPGFREYNVPKIRNKHTYRYKDFFKATNDYYVPCWSVARLIEIEMICDTTEHKTALDRALSVDCYDIIPNFNLIDWCVNEIIGRAKDGKYDFSRLND